MKKVGFVFVVMFFVIGGPNLKSHPSTDLLPIILL
jgi:hypothetical protein